MTPAQFFATALPYARWAHAQTGVDVSVILAQWADETDYGGPDWSPNNNPGNVGSFDGRPVAVFPTLEAGLLAYVATMNSPDYAPVRAASGWLLQADALGRSPWASGHYGSPPGATLVGIIHDNELWQYDPAPAAPEGEVNMIEATPSGNGYYIVTPAGAVFAYGDAVYHGGINDAGPAGASAMVPGDACNGIALRTTGGYWLSTTAGRVYGFGGAPYLGAPG